MAVHDLAVRRMTLEREWRQAGCDLRCREERYIRPGILLPIGVVIHDAEAHEEHGRRIAEARTPSLVKPIIRTRGLAIDTQRMTVHLDGRLLRLTPIETSIVVYLATRLDQLCLKDDVIRIVWGADHWQGETRRHSSDSQAHHTLRVCVSRMRRKLGTSAELIVTHSAFGYRLCAVTPTDIAP